MKYIIAPLLALVMLSCQNSTNERSKKEQKLSTQHTKALIQARDLNQSLSTNIGRDRLIPKGDSIAFSAKILYAQEPIIYQWFENDILISNKPRFIKHFKNTGNFAIKLQIQDANSSKASDELKIEVKELDLPLVPHILEVSPKDKSIKVSKDTSISIKFSSSIKDKDNAFIFEDEKANKIAYTSSYDKNTNTLTLKPNTKLKDDTEYKIYSKIYSGNKGLFELASFSFNTGDGKKPQPNPTPNTSPSSSSSEFLGTLATGQITSYQKGDDGYYQKGIKRRYTRENGIVTDLVTKLQWQDDYTDNQGSIAYKNWEDAKSYCANLSLGAYSDWRLPSVDELLSIVDNSKYDPAISSVFEKTTSSGYWSSTANASDTSVAWGVLFDNGYTGVNSESGSGSVRCVRDRN